MIVLRYGELFLKGANRPHFESLLRRNVERALAGLSGVKLQRAQGRLFAELPAEDEPEAAARLATVFGLASLSRATAVEPDMDRIGEVALEQVAAALAAGPRPSSFRVSVKRSDKRFPVPSPEIGRLVGAKIFEATGINVDLSNPELDVGVEVGTKRTFVFTGRIQGAGGLPVGASGNVALLLSGGIDSPVAGHLMQKRGCQLEAIYFHSPPYTGERARDKVEQLAGKLARAQGGVLPLHVVPFTAVQEAVRDGAPPDLAVVLYRRSMLRIAQTLARTRRCQALASGENLGQVASQTLENMVCIQAVSELPLLRPLLAFDKAETIAIARVIGTYDLSILPFDDCCSLFVPRHPATKARKLTVEKVERRLELEPVEEAAVEGTELVETKGVW